MKFVFSHSDHSSSVAFLLVVFLWTALT
jgi:hypothetical protein